MLYRGIQILHTYILEIGREVYPLMAIAVGCLINICLYCSIAFYSKMSPFVVFDMLLLNLLLILGFKMYLKLAYALEEDSKELTLSYLRNFDAAGFSPFQRKSFKSFRPLAIKFEFLFTVSRNIYPKILRNVIVDNVITLLLTFRDQ